MPETCGLSCQVVFNSSGLSAEGSLHTVCVVFQGRWPLAALVILKTGFFSVHAAYIM